MLTSRVLPDKQLPQLIIDQDQEAEYECSAPPLPPILHAMNNIALRNISDIFIVKVQCVFIAL